MNHLPILFSASMVRALLAGAKTQTRRVMKNQPSDSWEPISYGELHGCGTDGVLNPDRVIGWGPADESGEDGYKCPYGQPGNRLWVREAWRTVAEADHLPPRELTPEHRIWYEADADRQPGAGKLRPSMFMPRWASRTTLEVTDIRVEPLKVISEADAIAEGGKPNYLPNRAYEYEPYKSGYVALWQGINGNGSWAANPWVWVVSFKKL